LLRANYTNQALLINHTDDYLVKFFENPWDHADHLLLDQEEALESQLKSLAFGLEKLCI